MTSRYHLLRPLSAGSTANVWEAEAIDGPHLGRPVVVKRIATDGDAARRRFFAAEALALITLRHPNLVELLDFGRRVGGGEGEELALVFARVDGVDLARGLLAAGPLPCWPALRVLADVASALALAHQPRDGAPAGIVHRDIRAENVLLDREGIARLADFGLSHGPMDREPTASDVLRGTPSVIAPELVQGQRGSSMSDIWALGMLLHQLLAGRSPVRSWSDARAIAQGRPLDVAIAPDSPARALFDACVARAPTDRPSAPHVCVAAEELLATSGHLVRPQLAVWCGLALKRRPPHGSLDALFASPVAQTTLVLEPP